MSHARWAVPRAGGTGRGARSVLLAAWVVTACVSISACGETAPEHVDTTERVAPELSETELFPALRDALREAGTYTFEMTRGPEGHRSTMSGSVRVRERGLELAASSTSGPPVEVLLLATGHVFIKSPDVLGHDLWVKRDLADPGSAILGSVTGAEFLLQDPKALADLEVVESDTVDGVPVDHYRCEIDYARLRERVGGGSQTSAGQTIVADLWVDADDLLRRFVLTPGFEVTSAFNLPTEGTYSDFGTDVEIEAPPADQVTEDFPGTA